MIQTKQLVLVLPLVLIGASRAFVTQPRNAALMIRWLSADGGDSETTPRTRRRRRRSAPTEALPFETNEEEDIPSVVSTEKDDPLRPRQDAPVALAVPDVRNIVSGNAPVAPYTSASSENLSDNTPDDTTVKPVDSSFSSVDPTQANADDSLARLLQDAKEMQAQESDTAVSTDSTDEPSIPKMISSVLSTIVTVDFFIVCGFLLWFLAGIFSSYVLQDDGIQIAFNSNFETLVQPALGVLMIAAIAGNFFKEEEVEQ